VDPLENSPLHVSNPTRGSAALRGDSLAADNSGMLAKRVGLTVTATGFAVAFAAIFGRRPTVTRGAR
jgi:hypothetical protein